MTDVAPTTVQAGNTVTLGRLTSRTAATSRPAASRSPPTCETDPTISGADHEIGSFSWGNFPGTAAWRNGSVTMQVPSGTPAGTYFIGMVLTTSAGEISTANNTAILARDHNTGFDPIKVTVIN